MTSTFLLQSFRIPAVSMGEGEDDLQVCADFACLEGFFCKFVYVLQRPNTFYGRLSEISKIKRTFLLIPF